MNSLSKNKLENLKPENFQKLQEYATSVSDFFFFKRKIPNFQLANT